MPVLAKLLAAALLGATSQGAPAAITLNGVDIAGVTSQRFENATVVIDEKGAVHIEAKGYSVRTVETGTSPQAAPTAGATPAAPTPASSPATAPAPRAPPATTLIAASTASPAVLVPTSSSTPSRATTRRYFLVTQQSQPDGTQYDVSVFINSQWIREVRSAEENVVMEVSKFLRLGQNKVTLEARKRSGDRHGAAPDATLRVIVGEGSAQGNDVTIDDPVVDMRRNAAETESFTEEYSLVAR
ncbi:MAG TPA: hypothetical protein VFE30_09025 [Anaeromyxobacteraceae bacterium]|jgi:hypothetical protein|nr:hypothetical protein [Anaeromyxobacteraceae bacterium]